MVKNVDKASVLNASGIPFVIFDFNPREGQADDTLMTDFLSAIQSFVSEVFKMKSDQLLIDNGKHRISLFKTRQLTAAIILKENFFAFKDQFTKFLLYVIIQFDETRIAAKTDKFLSLMEKPEEIERFAQQWIQFAIELVVEFYPAIKEKFISQFYNLIVELYLNVIHKRDFDLLTPILTKLEEL